MCGIVGYVGHDGNAVDVLMDGLRRLENRGYDSAGVATLNVEGQRRLAIRLWIDHHRLTARGLVVADVTEALREGNVDIPSGRVESVDQEFSVRTPGELRSAEDYNDLVIANFDGKPVRIRDAAGLPRLLHGGVGRPRRRCAGSPVAPR